jgi:hypothetical protein
VAAVKLFFKAWPATYMSRSSSRQGAPPPADDGCCSSLPKRTIAESAMAGPLVRAAITLGWPHREISSNVMASCAYEKSLGSLATTSAGRSRASPSHGPHIVASSPEAPSFSRMSAGGFASSFQLSTVGMISRSTNSRQ